MTVVRCDRLVQLGLLALLCFVTGCGASPPPTAANEQSIAQAPVGNPASIGTWRMDERTDAMTDKVTVFADIFSDSGMFWVACEQSESSETVYSVGVADGSRLGRWTNQSRRETLVRFDREEPVSDLNWWYGDQSAYLDDQSHVLPFIERMREAQAVTIRLTRNDFSRSDVTIQPADPSGVLTTWESRCADLAK